MLGIDHDLHLGFGMRFDAMRDGRFIVSNEVQISIEGEVVEVKDQAAAASA